MNNQFTWLHIGLGSFHRASGVVSASSDCFRGYRWRIAAGIFATTPSRWSGAGGAGRTLRPRDRQPGREREYEEITSIQKLLPWQAGLQPLINEGANPQTKVIAFTVTEGGTT